MDRVKNYSGTISEDTATKAVKQYYGATSNTTAKKGKTELLNNKIQEFLTECGAESRYDGEFLWINGVPMVFCFSGASNYYTASTPFNASIFFNNSNYTTVFSGINYNFKMRLLGEPTVAFVLLISTNYTAPTFNNGFNMAFYKAEDILSGRESRIYWNTGTSSGGKYAAAVIGLEDNGTPVNIGRNTAQGMNSRLDTIADDFNNNKNRFPLVEWMPNFFKVSGCYYDLVNDPLPKASNTNADAQTFIKIGGNVYYRQYLGPLLRGIT